MHAYSENGSEAAFAELVRRYVDFVYSAARRMVCDLHLAEDVTQAVFVAFAKNAQHLADRPLISGWLHRTSQNIAAQTVRTIERRRAREKEAVTMNELLAGKSESNWEEIEPHLDHALGELTESDRDAVLLRYFERKSAREIAKVFATSEEAAQKRVNRAVERLRDYFTKRNVRIGASSLIALISLHGVQAAPAALLTAISSTATVAAATMAHAPAIAVTKTIAMTTLQKFVVGSTLVVAIGAGLYQAQQVSQLKTQLESAKQKGPDNGDLEQLKHELAETTEQLAAIRKENDQLKRDNAELYKLRGEVPRLRNESRELTQLKTNPASDATISEALKWKERVKLLKQYAEQNPDASIPELQFATEQDWLDAASKKIETPTDYRIAMSSLRGRVENKFAGMLQKALRKYMKENNDQFPSELSLLQPYFNSPVDDAILERYVILPGDGVPSLYMGKWIISQKAPVDKEFDGRTGVGPNGYGSTGTNGWDDPKSSSQVIQKTLNPAIKAYAAANGGRQPDKPSDLMPYLKTPEEKAALEKAIELLEANSK